MPIFEKLRKAEQDEKVAQEAESGEKRYKGDTLKEIRMSDENSLLFGLHLEKKGLGDLSSKFKTGNLSPEDISSLASERQDFLETLERANGVAERFGNKNIEQIIAISPELQELEGGVGAKGIRDAVLRNIKRLAIEDPEHFEAMSNAVEEFDKVIESQGEEDKEILAICKKYGMREDNYLEALGSDDLTEIRDLIKGGVKGKGLWFSKKRKTGIEDEIDAADHSSAIKKLSQDYDERLKDIAKALRVTLVENKAVFATVTAEISGQQAEKMEPEMKFSEFRIPTEEDGKKMQEEFLRYEQEHMGDSDYSPASALTDFQEDYIKKNVTKGKSGWWSKVAKDIWSSFISGKGV